MVVFPFEMDLVARLSESRNVGTSYGFYGTIVGIGILAGNLFTGMILDKAHSAGVPAAPWLGLILLGLFCAGLLRRR